VNIVWARANVVSRRCPKSVITAQSLGYLERFRLWKELGTVDLADIDAKTADALVCLESAWKTEVKNGEV